MGGRAVSLRVRMQQGGRVSPIDRFTRDERSAMVWWPFALLLIVLCIATVPGEHRAVEDERAAAVTRSVGYLQGVLVASIGSADLRAPLSGSTAGAARSSVERDIMHDTRVTAVRLWTPAGTLLFSTASGDTPGSGGALNDAEVAAAAAGEGVPVSVVSERSLAGKPGPTTFHTYVALVGTATPAVGEVELSDAALLSSVHGAWLRYQIILGLGSLLVLGLAILSFREPTATMGTGVPFYPTSIPRGYALIDLDEQAKLEQGTANARVAHVEAKLRESEEARRMVEGQLQRALSAIATRKATTKGIEPVFPRPAAPSPVGRRPAVLVPQPVPSDTPTIGVPALSEVPGPEPVVAEPSVLRKRARPKAKPKPEPKPEPKVVAAPAPEPVVQASEPEPITISEPDAAREPEPAKAAASESVLQLPEIDRGFVLRVPDVAPDADDETAVNVLERLVEPFPGHTTDVDPSVVRQRLTRLAASKKPGPRSEEPHGSAEKDPEA
jgi:hypothetical protein